MNQPPSIKKNYLYNTAFTIAGFLFPLITFPYVARVLGPVYIGKVAFAESIVAYFSLLASLGIPLYGIREVAKVRDDKTALNRVFSELFIINLLAMGISALLFLSLFFLIDKIRAEEVLFLVLGINIILGAFSIEWLYKGLENYQYITLRSLFFKLISLGLLFLLVRSQGDYVWFAGISVLALSGANILNMINSRKYVKLILKDIQLKKHIKPILVLFSTSIAISIYINLDKVMLGFLAGDASVGLYTAAVKINRILLTVVISLGAVLLPRMSYYVEKKKMDEFTDLADKSIRFIYMLAFPFMIGLFLLANPVIQLFSGPQFVDSIITLRILVPIILLIGISNFIGIQILLPRGGEKKLLYSTLTGAGVNFTLNLFLIPIYKHNGAAAATVIAELCVTLTQFLFIKEYAAIDWFKKKANYVLFSLLMGLIIFLFKFFLTNAIVYFFVSIIIGGGIYLCLLIFFKDELVEMAWSKFKISSLKIR